MMDINRNVLHHDPSKRRASDQDRMTAFWGDDSWQEDFYAPPSQLSLFGQQPDAKAVKNDQVAEAFRQRLLGEAGFSHVPIPLPMRNSSGAV